MGLIQSEEERYIRGAIRYWVWSGFHDQASAEDMLQDILEENVSEREMVKAIAEEFRSKAKAERLWPAHTDCDKLDAAFVALDAAGICAVQNAGYTMSDGVEDVAQALDDRGRDKYHGYCFFHGQDLERAIDGHGLMLAFGDLNDDPSKAAAVGRSICDALAAAGLPVEWQGDVGQRIDIPKIDWKRRY